MHLSDSAVGMQGEFSSLETHKTQIILTELALSAGESSAQASSYFLASGLDNLSDILWFILIAFSIKQIQAPDTLQHAAPHH